MITGPQMKIITVAGNDIRRLSPSLSLIEIIYEEVTSEISGIDVNAKEETIYWSNSKTAFNERIYVLGFNVQIVEVLFTVTINKSAQLLR